MSGPSSPDPISEATQDSFPSTMTDSLPTGSSSSHSLLSDSSSRVSPSGDGPPSARRKKDGTQQDLNTIRHHGKEGQHRPSSTNRHDDSGMALDASEMEAANDVEELPFARPPKFKPNQFSGPQQRLPIHAEDFADLEDLASLQDERPQKLNSVSHQHQNRSGRGHGGGRHRKDTKQSDGTNTGVNAENGNHSPVHEVHSGKTTDTGKDDPNVQSQMPVNSSKEVDSFPLDGRPAQVKTRARQRPTVLEQNAPPSQGQGIRPFHDADNSLPGGLGRQQVQEKPHVEVPATSTRRKPEEDREVRRPVLVPQMGPPAAVNSTTTRSPTDQGANVTPPKRRNGLPQASKQHFESVESQRQRMSTPVGDLEGPRPTPNRAHAARRNETPRSSRTPSSGHVQRREHASRRDIEPRRGEIHNSEQPSRPLREEDLCVSGPRVPSRQSNVSRVRRTRNQDRSRSRHREVNGDLLRPRSGHRSKDMNLSSICEMIYGLEATEAESRKTIDELWQQKQDLEQQVYSMQQTHRSLVDKSLQYEKSYNELAADSQQRAAQMKHQENRLNRVLEQRDHLRAESSKMRAELESSRVKQSELQEDVIRAEAEIEKEAGRNRKRREETSKQTELELMALKEEQKVTIDGLKAQLEAKRDAYENEKRALKDLQVDFATLKEHLSGAEAKAKGLDSQLTEIKQSNDGFQKIEAIMAKIFTGIENLAEKSDQADVVPPQIVKKLDEIAEFAQRASREDNDGTRKALDAFQEQMTSKIGEKIIDMTKGQNSIQGRMQSLEEYLKSQSSLVEAEQKRQQEQQQRQITEKSVENARLAQNLDTKDKQVTELTKAVSEMGQRLQKFEEALESVAKGAASETELQAAQESLNTSETRVNQLRAELQSQRAAYESEKTDLEKQLEKAKDDLKKTEDLLKTSAENTASAEREFNAASDEKRRELEETVKKEQEAYRGLKQRHDELSAEKDRLQKESAETFKREQEKLTKAEKDLKVADQRITNLTMKIRETQTTSTTANPNDLTPQQLKDQLKMVRECHRLMEDMQADGKDLPKGNPGAPGPSNSLRDDQQLSNPSSGHQHSGASGNADNGNNDGEPELPEVPCTDPINWKDILEISSSSSDGILEEDSQQKSGDILEEDLQRKRVLVVSPFEAANPKSEAPSISQERAQRRNSTSQASQRRSILRSDSSYTPTAASTDTAESPREHVLSTHSGHTKYNRPVGSRDTISYTKFSSLSSRKLPRPQLIDFLPPNDTDHNRQHVTKRSRTQPPQDRPSKRIKHVSDPRDRDDVFTDRLENVGQPTGSSSLERSPRASTEALSIKSPDNSSMSRHFQTGTSAKNGHQLQTRPPLADKTPQSSKDGPSSTGRRNIRTYSKLPVKT